MTWIFSVVIKVSKLFLEKKKLICAYNAEITSMSKGRV